MAFLRQSENCTVQYRCTVSRWWNQRRASLIYLFRVQLTHTYHFNEKLLPKIDSFKHLVSIINIFAILQVEASVLTMLFSRYQVHGTHFENRKKFTNIWRSQLLHSLTWTSSASASSIWPAVVRSSDKGNKRGFSHRNRSSCWEITDREHFKRISWSQVRFLKRENSLLRHRVFLVWHRSNSTFCMIIFSLIGMNKMNLMRQDICYWWTACKWMFFGHF